PGERGERRGAERGAGPAVERGPGGGRDERPAGDRAARGEHLLLHRRGSAASALLHLPAGRRGRPPDRPGDAEPDPPGAARPPPGFPAAGHRLPTGGRADGAPGGAADRAAAPVGRLHRRPGRGGGPGRPGDRRGLPARRHPHDRDRGPAGAGHAVHRSRRADLARLTQASRRASAGAGGPATAGWKIPARASTPSTSRGPGRANDALASTAHTGTPAGNAPVASTDSVNRAAAGRSNPQGAQTTTSGAAARTASQVVRKDRSPGSPRTHSPPAAMTISGTQ